MKPILFCTTHPLWNEFRGYVIQSAKTKKYYSGETHKWGGIYVAKTYRSKTTAKKIMKTIGKSYNCKLHEICLTVYKEEEKEE